MFRNRRAPARYAPMPEESLNYDDVELQRYPLSEGSVDDSIGESNRGAPEESPRARMGRAAANRAFVPPGGAETAAGAGREASAESGLLDDASDHVGVDFVVDPRGSPIERDRLMAEKYPLTAENRRHHFNERKCRALQRPYRYPAAAFAFSVAL
eukprot:GHVU01147228.1.p2 GENE.GHVU01147228.1~~GHVU01147228.1.p2  ORF type:complete len:155 (-),score=17.44 GHVU01147228.1:1793-2257(-)